MAAYRLRVLLLYDVFTVLLTKKKEGVSAGSVGFLGVIGYLLRDGTVPRWYWLFTAGSVGFLGVIGYLLRDL